MAARGGQTVALKQSLLAAMTVLAIAAVSASVTLAVDKEKVIKDRQALMKEQAGDLAASRLSRRQGRPGEAAAAATI